MRNPDAVAMLHGAVRQRDLLRAAFDLAWAQLPKADEAALADWADACLHLIRVNAGASCHLAFWNVSAGGEALLGRLAVGGRAAAEICRHAGAGAALACVRSMPETLALLKDDQALLRWWQGLELLSREAADCVVLAASRARPLLADRSGETFSQFVAIGLGAHTDGARRRAFFSLEDGWARALLRRRAGVPDAAALSRMLSAFSAALWERDAVISAAPASDAAEPRAAIVDRAVLLPATIEAGTVEEARARYTAMVAHVGAHLALPPVCRRVGPLKPLQIVLINLLEDARVEALAMRRFPGLRRLWEDFHVAVPATGLDTAPSLMARLSRALFDASYTDTDGFVAKGRAMFAAEAAHGLEDAELSLRIGRVLGHDLGQMRLRFEWRDYVVEPSYRDDGAHLWDDPTQLSAPLELTVEAGRASADQSSAGGGGGSAGRAREIPPDQRGQVIATYPEWDAATGVERPDWTTLREVPPAVDDPAALLAAFERERDVGERIDRLVRAAAIGRPVRLRRQEDGEELDMTAALDAMIALRAGMTPDTRLSRATRRTTRDLATMVVLDASASTAATLPDGRSVLDVQRLAVGLLAQAVGRRGNPIALSAFRSDGREDVRLQRIKTFSEAVDTAMLSRLAGLRAGLSTRLGPTLRHAREEFGALPAWRRLLLVLTDAEPSDVDVADSRDLIVDARRAVLGLKAAGIDVFGLILDPDGVGAAATIFGRANAIAIRDLADLPAQLAGLYARLARQ
jgi:hypothetical protein